MRCAALGTLAVLLLGACGDTIADRIDAVARTGRHVHGAGETRFGDAPAVRSLAPVLRKEPAGASLLDGGDAVAARLVGLLDDPSRRTLAVVFLAEIGGDRAARELARRWRAHRDDARSTSIYRQLDGGSWKLGYRYEGVDDDFYGELLMALGYAGLPVSPEIAKDTLAAIEESDRLAARGVDLLSRAEREEDGRPVELRWWAAPVETAREGLRILALLRAPEAPSVFGKAMRSPVAAIRRTAVEDVLFLRDVAERLLPSLGPLLDDPDLSADAAEQVGFLLEDATTVAAAPIRALPVDRRAAVVGHCKERLRALGHLER